jgi:bacteriophage exclusion system BrxA-like protein
MTVAVAARGQDREATVAPALDATAPYFSRLSARSAMYTELHQLLDARREFLSLRGYRALVLEENVLGRSTSSARNKLWKELKSRYRLDAEDLLFEAFWTEWRRCECDQERGLTAYVLLALNDRFVADLGTDWLFTLVRRAPAQIRVPDILAFISRAEATHPEVTSWSPKTRLAVAQKYAASVRDFGLAKGTSHKTTIRPALYASPVRFLVKALRLAGTGPLDLVRARIFRLLAVDESEVIDALGELNRLGALRFRMQGDIIELDVLERA